MSLSRRRFLGLGVGACALPLRAALADMLPRGAARRAVIVGGGWGGLSAARHLRMLAPGLEVVLLERNADFWSLPLSNRWLTGRLDGRHLRHGYAQAARRYGYTFLQAEATAVDRERRRVVTTAGALDYDWLVLAVGIGYDYAALLGDDRRAIDYAREHYPCAFTAGNEVQALKAKLDGFAGGDLVMTLPPAPYRCPPAPYERAAMIAAAFKVRRLKAKLIVLDPNPLMAGFSRVFEEQYRDQIVYLPHARIKAFDPFGKTIATEFDTLRFDDAVVMAPQQAGELVRRAGLAGRDAQGKPSGWADADPVHLHARDDEKVFLIGDLMGQVSPLFGAYPKTGQMASRLGGIAAAEIAARAAGREPARLLPDSLCHVYTSVEPPEALRIESSYRFRGDGVIVQTTQQHFNPHPQDEDLRWAQGMFADLLAAPPDRGQ